MSVLVPTFALARRHTLHNANYMYKITDMAKTTVQYRYWHKYVAD